MKSTMSKSRIKHPIMKITGHRVSDKKDRSTANRKLRRKVKMLIKKGLDFFPILKEISDKWGWNSDGGSYWMNDLDEKFKRK